MLNLKQMLAYFLEHRKEVVYRRCCLFDLERAREKAHGLEGLAVAISNVEEVIDIIKKAPSPQDAKQRLMAKDWKLQDRRRHARQAEKARARPGRRGSPATGACAARARPASTACPSARRRPSSTCGSRA